MITIILIYTYVIAVLENDEENESEYTENEEEEGIADSANSLSEQYFDFPGFIKRFVRPKIIQACCLLLAQFERNTSSTNHSVLKLLHRIAFDCKFEAMLFQASVFRTFQRILASSDSQHKELQKFAVYIVRKFVTLAQRDSKAFVDFLFWKNNIEAYEMIEGIGSFSNKQQDKTVLWSEEQEDELRRLCVEYEKDKPDEDMVDWIHKNLINASRSRRGLIKKLKELYLLPEKGSRSKSARPPKEFSEQEILQISQLFNEHRNAEDPIGSMLNLLDVKRPRKRIIDKIVELGLVQDRKELRKKTNRKKSSQQNDESGSENEQSTEDDYSDDDDENRNVINEGNYVENEFGPATHGDPSTSSRRNNEKRITEKSHDYSLSSKIVTDSIVQVVRNGMKESIDWILECFEEFLDDITDSESDVPLVPLTENAVKALDNKTFQQMLTYIGIRRPSDEQEVYWRIPGNWQANDIRKRIEVIKNVTNNECSNADESLRHQTNVESTEANLTDSYNDNENQCVNDSVNETVETIAINNDENDHHDAVDNTINNRISEITDGINGDEDEMRLKNNRKRIHRIVDSSDEDDAADSLVENLNTSDNFDEPSMVVGRNQNTFSFNNNKRRKIIAIDSDSE